MSRKRIHIDKGTPGPQEIKGRPPYTVCPETGCWVWQRTTEKLGYGTYRLPGRRVVKAHIYYWAQANGAVPEGMELDHTCRRRNCVNPDHLEPVPHAMNVRRGRRCKLTPANVRFVRAVGRSIPATEMARQLGVSQMAVLSILNNKTWRGVA